jgi:FkbM family methyltransferase
MNDRESAQDAILAKIDEMLVRERLFREDFEHRLRERTVNEVVERLAQSRLRSPLTYFPDAKVLIHTVDGQRLILDMRESFMALHLIEHGEWEAPVRDQMRRILPPGGVFVDVGANIGAHSLFAASLVGPTGRIVALEPHPITRDILRENVEINGLVGRVEVVAAAAGAESGQGIDFQYFPRHPAMSGFAIGTERLQDFPGGGETISVAVTTLDELRARNGLRVDLLKIDVEGFELAVLRGAARLLAENDDLAVLIEYDAKLVTSVLGADAKHALEALARNAGFHAFRIENRGPPIRIETPFSREVSGDFLLVRANSPYYPSHGG